MKDPKCKACTGTATIEPWKDAKMERIFARLDKANFWDSYEYAAAVTEMVVNERFR